MLIRDEKIDVLRGIAISIMFLAHSLPCDDFLAHTTNFYLRIICSLAAPIFLFLVGINFSTKSLNFKNTFKRFLITILIASTIDVFLWGIIPFYSFDVLYIISLTLIILYLIHNLKESILMISILVIILITFCFHYFGIYEELLFEPKISDLKDFNSISLFKNLFLNGWFPIFPWIIFPLIGFLVKKRKLTLIGFNYFVISLILFVFTTILKFNETNYLREEAIELFYPANLTYIFLAVSFIVLIKNIVHFLPFEKLKIFQLFGRASLFFYVFHLTMVHLFFKKFSENLEIHFINTFILFFLFFLVVALIINQFKKSKLFLKDNFILKTIFGN
jgi:uncharacterized protein